MKKTIKLIGAIAFITLLAFAMSCGAGAGGGEVDGEGNTTISGDNIASEIPVTYNAAYVANIEDAKKATNFSFVDGGSEPLSDWIDGSSSATISGGKATIILGKSRLLDEIYDDHSSITINPSSANGFLADGELFFTFDGKYILLCIKDINNYANLVYVDRDVTINGSCELTKDCMGTYNNVSLKKGWNYLVLLDSGTTVTYTGASTTMPSGFNWTVVEPDIFWP